MKSLIAFGVLATMVTPQLGFSEERSVYLGAGVTYLEGEYDSSVAGGDLEDKTGGFELLVGGTITPYLDFQVRYGKGGTAFSDTVLGTDVEVDIDYKAGAYLTLHPVEPLGDLIPIEPYLIAGYTSVKATAELPDLDLKSDDRDEDISYGAGVTFSVNEWTFVDFEYMHLYDENDLELQQFLLGFRISLY
jgi:opacity protein-like surface antigen